MSSATWTSSERAFLISRDARKVSKVATEDPTIPLNERLENARNTQQLEACLKAAATMCAFKCPFCDQTFTQKKSTVKHVKSKTACKEIRKTLEKISEHDEDLDSNTSQSESAEVQSQISEDSQSEGSLFFPKKGKFDIFMHFVFLLIAHLLLILKGYRYL